MVSPAKRGGVEYGKQVEEERQEMKKAVKITIAVIVSCGLVLVVMVPLLQIIKRRSENQDMGTPLNKSKPVRYIPFGTYSIKAVSVYHCVLISNLHTCAMSSPPLLLCPELSKQH